MVINATLCCIHAYANHDCLNHSGSWCLQDILSRLLQVFLIFLIISLTYLLKCTDICELDVMESSVYVSPGSIFVRKRVIFPESWLWVNKTIEWVRYNIEYKYKRAVLQNGKPVLFIFLCWLYNIAWRRNTI